MTRRLTCSLRPQSQFVKPNPRFLVETFTHSFQLPFLFILFKNLFLFRSFLPALFIPLQFLSSRYVLESCSYSHFTISLFFLHIMLHTISGRKYAPCLAAIHLFSGWHWLTTRKQKMIPNWMKLQYYRRWRMEYQSCSDGNDLLLFHALRALSRLIF